MEGNRVEVQVEAGAAREPQFADGVEPQTHQFLVGLRSHAATVLGEKTSFGHDIEPGKQCQTFIEDVTHDVAVAGGAEQLQRQQAAHGLGRRNHPAAGESSLLEDAVQTGSDQRGEEQEQASEAGAEFAGLEIEFGNAGHCRCRGAGAGRALLILTAGQAGKAFLLEEQRDGHRTDRLAFAAEELADVVDRQILLAQGDDLVPQALGLGGRFRAFGRRQEEPPVRVLAELMGEDAEASGGVSATASGLGGGKAFDEVGAKGFVLAMSGVLGLEEEAGEIGY